ATTGTATTGGSVARAATMTTIVGNTARAATMTTTGGNTARAATMTTTGGNTARVATMTTTGGSVARVATMTATGRAARSGTGTTGAERGLGPSRNRPAGRLSSVPSEGSDGRTDRVASVGDQRRAARRGAR